MYEPHNFLNLHDCPDAAGADPNAYNSGGGGDNFSTGSSSPPLNHILPSASVAGNVDQRLLRDLVDMVPLVQSLIEQKQRPSFMRRGSVIYTKTPSKESLSKKDEEKGRNAAQPVSRKKQRDRADKDPNNTDGFSMISSRSSLIDKDREELMALRERVEDLQKKLYEKDELLKSVEKSKSEMVSVLAEVNELKEEAAARESLLKTTQLHLSGTKIKLADKQAAVEKLEWEAMTSNNKVEKLQQDIDSAQSEISTMMQFFDSLQMKDTLPEDFVDAPYCCDLVNTIDDFDESMLEEAREAYVIAVASAKETQGEASIFSAAKARSHLQSLVLERNRSTCNGDSGYGAMCY